MAIPTYRHAVNQVSVSGTIMAEPTLRFTRGGMAVMGLRIAQQNPLNTNDESGEWAPCDFGCDVVIFGNLAEKCVESLQPGVNVLIYGRLLQRHWKDKNGNERSSWTLRVNNIGPTLLDEDDEDQVRALMKHGDFSNRPRPSGSSWDEDYDSPLGYDDSVYGADSDDGYNANAYDQYADERF